METNEKGQFKPRDITGHKFNLVTALYQTSERYSDGGYIWVMRCDCGKEFKRSASCFKKSKSCGCLMKNNSGQQKVKDLTGIVVNGYKVIEPTDERRYTYTVWILNCHLCGENFKRTSSSIIKKQVAHRCKQWYEQAIKPTGRKSLPNNQSFVNAFYNRYKYAALQRGFEFNLTKDEMRVIIEKPCEYCGEPPIKSKDTSYKHISKSIFPTSGIDRVDSSKGYFVDNCVPCCKFCNFMKSDMTKEEFLKRVKKINENS